ncbi:MAG: acetyl esterase [Actinomycetota bacterium]|nr:acetyl esterase [Actinomycetota bacterium]
MPLHPQAQAIITGLESMGLPPFETFSLEEGRQVIQTLGSFMIPAEEVASVVDAAAMGPEGDIPLRIFTPAGSDGDGPRPGILYFHGGGFSTGSIDLVEPVCRALANRSGCIVIAVGYRLGPEHPYPAAVTDAYVATTWIAANGRHFGIDRARLVVMGDSAGANLATVTCMVIRDNEDEVDIALQVLIYPVTDLAHQDTPSYKENGEGYLLTNGMMSWFKGHYLAGCGEEAVAEPYCSPMFMGELDGLPPAIIVTAEYDPLRDEGEAYGARLEQAGIPADVRREDGMIHGFFWMGGAIDRGRELLDELGADLRKALFD